MGRLAQAWAALRATDAPDRAWYEPEFEGSIAPRFGASDPVSARDGWFVRHVGGATKASVAVSEAGSLRATSVYGCVNRIANPLAMVPFRIYQRREGGGAQLVTQHPMSDRLGLRPNDRMSGRTVRKTLMGHALLWGNGYQEIERNGRGEAVGIWPLLADRTLPRMINGELVFRTNIGGSTIDLDPDNVIHVMDQSQDGYVGLSQIGLAREAVGMALAMEEFGAKFFANDAKSGGFLMHPGRLGTQAALNLRGGSAPQQAAAENPAARIERQSGLDNAHRVKVLEEGMKFVQTTIPPEDAQFLGSREFQIAEIARMFDVPLILLQSHEKSTSWGTGIEQLRIGFVGQTIAPWATAIEQEYNWKLFTPSERERGLYVKLNLNGLMRGDMAGRSAFYKAMFEVGGLSPNQILALEEFDPIGPQGDTYFVSTNVQTLDRAINPPEPAPVSPGTGTDPAPADDEEDDA